MDKTILKMGKVCEFPFKKLKYANCEHWPTKCFALQNRETVTFRISASCGLRPIYSKAQALFHCGGAANCEKLHDLGYFAVTCY